VFELRLASGRTIEASSATRFHALNGWKPLSKTRIDDRMAVPRRIPRPITSQEMIDAEVVLLAHMIGDGSCVRNQPIRYASIDEDNLRAVANAAKHFGVTAVRDEYPAARVTTLRLPAPYRLARGRQNPIAVWLDGLGLRAAQLRQVRAGGGLCGAERPGGAIPAAPAATDGSVWWDAKRRKGTVYYQSTSRRLIADVMQLLLRFGVYSRAYCAPKADYRDCWQLHMGWGGKPKALSAERRRPRRTIPRSD
jgi:replicative DNA helicase